jgi:hypothetical protein
MIKNIRPAEEAVDELYCDICKDLSGITGIPDEQPVIHKQITVAISFNCGHTSKHEGLFADIHLCNTCGDKLIDILKEKFNLEMSTKESFEGAQ